MMKNIKKITTLALALTLAVSNFIFTAETISAEVAKTETTAEIPALTVTSIEDIDISDEKVYPIKTLLSEKEEKDGECDYIIRSYDCIFINEETGEKSYSKSNEKINKDHITSLEDISIIGGTLVNSEDFEKIMKDLKLNRKTKNEENKEQEDTSNLKVNEVLATKSSKKKNIKKLKMNAVNRIIINVDENDTSKTKYRVKFKVPKMGRYSFTCSNLSFNDNDDNTGEIYFNYYENKSKKGVYTDKRCLKTSNLYAKQIIALEKNDFVYLTILESNITDKSDVKSKSYKFDLKIKYEGKFESGGKLIIVSK